MFYDHSEPFFDPALQREFRGRWRHLDADHSPMNLRDEHSARPIRNRELFDWLDEQEAIDSKWTSIFGTPPA